MATMIFPSVANVRATTEYQLMGLNKRHYLSYISKHVEVAHHYCRFFTYADLYTGLKKCETRFKHRRWSETLRFPGDWSHKFIKLYVSKLKKRTFSSHLQSNDINQSRSSESVCNKIDNWFNQRDFSKFWKLTTISSMRFRPFSDLILYICQEHPR